MNNPDPGIDDFADLGYGTYTVIVDGIEDGLARVFLEQDGEEIADALLDPSVLPSDGRHADAILELTITDEGTVTFEYDAETTDSRREAAQDRFDRLSRRPPSDDES